ncbi:MAG: fatty acid desaturase [Gammaproteobacteria bacterium]|nr:fatty acid desaturase [Gammaproteobacteria bacterium]MDH5653506.1 fatty acid desaturase [Gammaproteobacteria bacterium]
MLLHYKSDWFNVVRALSAPLIFLFPWYYGLPVGHEIPMIILLWLLLNDINHVLHLHVHHPFTRSPTINLFLDLCMGLVTGMTAGSWRIHHIFGHHHFDPDRPNPWEMGTEREMRRYTILSALSYSLRVIPLLFFKPMLAAWRNGVLHNITTPLNYRAAFLEQIALILSVALLVWIKPELFFMYLLPWYLLVYFVTCYTDYLNHFACEKERFNSANNSLNRWYNKLGCNFGYHTAHHYKPAAHWSQLPAIHDEIKDQIKPDHLKTYSWSAFLLPLHIYLYLRGRL